jgi:hypothetical protein
MQAEGSLPCSQKPATGSYPDKDESSLYHSVLFLRSLLILYSHLRLGLPTGLFHSGFPTKILYVLLFFPYMLHDPPLSSSLSWSLYLYLAGGASSEAFRYAVVNIVLTMWIKGQQKLISLYKVATWFSCPVMPVLVFSQVDICFGT